MKSITLAEHNLIPDSLVRFGIRKLLKQRLLDESSHGKEERYELLLENLRQSPIAIETVAANAQHYEVPAAFYKYTETFARWLFISPIIAQR